MGAGDRHREVRRHHRLSALRIAAVAAVSALVVALLPAAIANASTVAELQSTLSSTAGGATGVTYSLSFATSSSGSLAGGSGTITLSAASGTVFPTSGCAYTVDDLTTNTQSSSTSCPTHVTIAGSGDEVTFTLPSGLGIAAGNAVALTAVGVTNPPAGSDTLQVTTSSDTSPASFTFTVVAPSPVANATASLSSLVGQATDVTYTFGFDSSPEGGLVGGEGTITLSAPSGTVFPPTPCQYAVDDVTTGKSEDCVTNLTVASSGNAATFTIPAGVSTAGGDNLNVVVSGVTNAQSGTEQFSLSDSSDSVAATTQQVVLSGNPGITSSVSNVSAALSSVAQGATGITYTITFTASGSGSLPAGGAITVVAPVGTVFDSGGQCDFVDDLTTGRRSEGCNSASFAGDGSIMTVSSGVPVNGGDSVSITATNVSNPELGSSVVSVSTVTDGIFAQSPSISLDGAQPVTGLTLAPSTAAAGANAVTDTITFTASDDGVLEPSFGTIDLRGTTGSSFPTSGGNCAYAVTDERTGTTGCANVDSAGGASSASLVVVSLPSNLVISAGDQVQLVVASATNPPGSTLDVAVSTSSDTVPVSASTSLVAAKSASLGTPSLSLSSDAAGASGVTLTLPFTTSSLGTLEAGTGTVTLTGPSGTNFPGNRCDYQFDDLTTQFSSGCATAVTTGAATATVTEPLSIRAGDQVVLTVTDLGNPGTGSDAVTLATSSDLVPVTTSSISLAAPKAVSLGTTSAAPAVSRAGGVTYSLTFTTSSEGALLGGSGQIDIEGVGGTYFPGGGNCSYQIYDVTTSTKSGCVSSVAEAAGVADLTLPSGFTINAGDTVNLEIFGAGNPSGSSQQLTLWTSSDPVPAAGSAIALRPGTSVTDPTLSISTPVAGAAAVNDTVTFVASSSLGSTSVSGNGAIELTASPNTGFPGNGCDYTVTDVTTSTSASCLGVSFPSPSAVDISMPPYVVNPGDEVSVQIGDAANTFGATEQLSVATTSDLVPAAAPAVSLADAVAPAAASASVSPATASATGVTDTIDFTASGQGLVQANAPSGVLIIGVPGSSFSGGGCNYTWTDLTTSDTASCISVGTVNNVLVISPPFPIHEGDSIEITANDATNPPTGSQQFQVLTASDSVPATTSPVTLTGATTATGDTGVSLSLGSTAQGGFVTPATVSWTETSAMVGGPVTVQLSPGMVFDDGNECDYDIADLTSGVSGNLCREASSFAVAGPRGNVVTFGLSNMTVAAGDQLQLSLPSVSNASAGSDSVSIATGADPSLVSSPAVALTPAQSPSAVSLAISSPLQGRADSTWTVSFTTSSTGALQPNAPITITTPPGTGLPGSGCDVTLTDVSTEHTASCVGLSDSATGSELTVFVPGFGIRAGDQVQITLGQMTNPGSSSAAVSVSTSTDLVPASSSPVGLTAGSSVTNASVSLSTPAAGAGWVTGTFSFTTSATGALPNPDDLIVIVGGPGVSFPGNNCWYTVTDLTNRHSASCVGNLAIDSNGQAASFSPPSGLDIAGGDEVEVSVSGMNNPAPGVGGSAPGVASFEIATTADGSPVALSEDLTAPASPAGLSISLSTPVAGASGVTTTVGFSASTTGALAPESSIELQAGPGTQWSGNGCDYTITDTTIGHSANCLSGLQITGGGSVVVLTTNDGFTINPGDSVEVQATSTTVAEASSDTIAVSTSSDPVPASSTVTLTQAASVSTPQLSVSSPAAGAVDVAYSVSFAVSATGNMAAGNGVIELLATPGTRLPGNNCDYTITDETNTHSVNCVNGLGLYDGGAGATFLVPSSFTVNGGDDLVVTVDGVTNPGAGSGSLSVATSSDTTPAATNAVSFTAAGSVSSASLATSSGAVGQAGVTYSASFTASASGGLASGSGRISLVGAAGTAFGNNGGSWCATVTDATTGRSGPCAPAAISANGSAVTVTTNVAVNPGDSVVLSLTGVTNPPVTSSEPAELFTSSDLVPVDITTPNLSGDAISGTVETTSQGTTSAVQGVEVEACPTPGGPCVPGGTTGANGEFSIAVPSGTYELQATPPPFGGPGSPSAYQAAAYGPVTASSGASATGIVINLPPEASVPSGVSVNGSSGDVPTIYWDSASTVTVTGCPDGMAEAVLQGTDSESGTTIVRDVPLTETPPGSGSYTGTIPPLYPVHGNVTVAPFVYCAPITAVLPYAGPTSGGTTVTIYGNSFTGATAVHFGSAAATDVQVVSATEITAVTPAGTGTVPVTVTTPAGTTPTTSLAQFSYLSVTGVSPDTGNVSGGGTVLVNGTGFTTAQQVFFGSTRAIFTVIDDESLIAYVPPAAAAGTVDVTVETSGGTSTTSAADHFTYASTAPTPSTPQQLPTPPATGSPQPCPTSGGPAFCDAPPSRSISNAPPLSEGFGGTMPDPSAIVDSLSSSVSYAVTEGSSPPDSSGDWTPVLQWNGSTDWIANLASIGDNVDSIMNGDVFASDIAEEEDFSGGLGSLSDTLAELIADTPLEDSFFDFALGPVGGIALAAFSLWCSSASPTGLLGGACAVANVPTDVMDFALGASLNLLQKLWNMYIDPSGTVVDDKGNPIAGATVTILGSTSGGLAGPYQAIPSGSVVTEPSVNPETSDSSGHFGWNVVPGWYEIEASKAGCYAPGSPSEPNVVTAPFDVPPPQDGLQLVMSCQSEPQPAAPTVTGLSTSSGPASGGTVVSIEGTGFSPSSTVAFGSSAATAVTFISSTALEATAPSGSGTVEVTVTGPGGTSSATPADQFTYISAPTVTALSTHYGTSQGGSLVQVDGTGFDHATGVQFGSSAAISFVVLSDTQIEATSPAGTGTVAVTVTSADGSSSTSSADQFTYTTPLALATTKLPAATAGIAYSTQLKASGGVAPYRWKLTSGRLPAGMSFSSTGKLSGTPTTTGKYVLGVEVSDSETPAASVTAGLSLVVEANDGPGYWITTVKGVVSRFGSALPHGSVTHLSGRVVGIAALAPPRGAASDGYFIATTTGMVYAFGAARVKGHPTKLATPVVAIAAAPKGDGYWLATAAGMVYAYGTAKSHGHLTTKPKSPIVGITPAPSGQGYWLLAADGAVYHFGSVKSYGSPRTVAGKAVAIVADAAGTGYWITTSEGKVYRFGSAKFYGDERRAPKYPVVAMAIGPRGAGYWLVGSNGVVYDFGSATKLGSVASPRTEVVGIAAA